MESGHLIIFSGNATAQTFGSLNAVVNSAGIQRYGNAEQTPLELWREVLDVNLTAAFLVSRAAIPHIRASGGGSIVNVGSVQSHAAQRGAVAYVTSKHAILGLTRAMAVDHAHEKIRVNCVCPGTVDTPMFRWTMSQDPNPESVLKACGQMHPTGRIARPEEIAEVIDHRGCRRSRRWRCGRRQRQRYRQSLSTPRRPPSSPEDGAQ